MENCDILVVDDDRHILELVKEYLVRFNLTADTTSSGKAALEMVQKRPYDIVFSDLMMPEISGL